MTRVVQAAGRLIRSPEDRGVIALFDRRFLAPMYADHLPGHWLPPGGVSSARRRAGRGGGGVLRHRGAVGRPPVAQLRLSRALAARSQGV